MTYTYTPRGVCSRQFCFEIDNNTILSLNIVGGCHGNLQGIASLLTGMKIEDAVSKLEGIRCGNKTTSCPDQIAKALKAYQTNL